MRAPAPSRALAAGTIWATALLLARAACATPQPVEASPRFTSHGTLSRAAAAGAAQPGRACRLQLLEVRDLRPAPDSMGEIGRRPVQAGDAAGWVRAAVEDLGRDPRIRLVGAGEPADVKVSVSILKAYILSITQVKAATVVIQARYDDAGTDIETYRGANDSPNWASSAGEAHAALNRALGKATASLHDAVLRRCSTAAAH